jgi:hypothetical protein
MPLLIGQAKYHPRRRRAWGKRKFSQFLKCMVRRPTAREKFVMKKVCVNVSGLFVEVLFSWP